MTWTKLGDEFVDDAADWTDAAVRTLVDMLAWSNRRGLDLQIPKRDLRRFAFSDHVNDAVTELGNLGVIADHGDTWEIVYRPEWQMTREYIETVRAKNRRYQSHRRGNHRYCDPTNCTTLSAPDTTPDNPPDENPDPGRVGVGSVRDKQLQQQPLAETTRR